MDEQPLQSIGAESREPDASEGEASVFDCGHDFGQSCTAGKLASLEMVSELSPKLPVSEAELDAILLLLGTDLARLMAD